MREIGAGRPGLYTHVGLGTFIDPRIDGGRCNASARDDLVEVVEIDGRELMRYKPFPVDVAIVRGSFADPEGNVSLDQEGANLDAWAVALAAHNSGGKVLVQVRTAVERGALPARTVRIPSAIVDAVVVEPDQPQSYTTVYDPALSGERRGVLPEEAPPPFSVRQVIARRAAAELREGAVINFGFGIPDGVAKLIAANGEVERYYQTIEHGTYGGALLDGVQFGYARNPSAMLDSPSQFDFYGGGGLDIAFLGMGELDALGNVNVSMLDGITVGPGGFIDIAQNGRKVVFCGTFEAKGARIGMRRRDTPRDAARRSSEARARGCADHFQRPPGGARGPRGRLCHRAGGLPLDARGRGAHRDRARRRSAAGRAGPHGLHASLAGCATRDGSRVLHLGLSNVERGAIMDPVRLAVIGVGAMGSRHARLALAEPQCELIATAEPVPETARLAQELGVAHYADYEEMLENARPDAVIIATPNRLHASVGIDCAARAVHALVEKPVAESVEAGRELVAAAERAGVRILVGHMRRFDPAVETAREIIRAGEIGSLIAVTVVWASRKSDDYFEIAWRRQPGGGPILTNLVHDIDSLRYICGDIESVYAEASSKSRGFEVEDTAAVLLRFETGALATIAISDAAPSPWGWELATGENPIVPRTGENCYRFLGSRGALDFPNLELWRQDGPQPGDWEQPLRREARQLPERASLARQLNHFCRVVRGEEAPRTDGADGLATLAATAAVVESSRRRQPVAPARIGTP